METDRLWEAISLVVDELPKETQEIISKISEIDDTVNYMDWDDWNNFCESGELQKYVREVFGLK